MTFKTHNETEIDVNGTRLAGSINASYDTLKQTFGDPIDCEGSGDKTDYEWLIEFEDKKVATIYNYKNGKSYLGSRGLKATNITDWHIGGYNEHKNEIFSRIKNLLKLTKN